MKINKFLLFSLLLTAPAAFAASDNPWNYMNDDFDIDAEQEHTHPLFGGELPASPSTIQHGITPHNAARTTYPCEACDKTFATIDEVVDHEDMYHYQETACNLCGQPENPNHLCDPEDLMQQLPFLSQNFLPEHTPAQDNACTLTLVEGQNNDNDKAYNPEQDNEDRDQRKHSEATTSSAKAKPRKKSYVCETCGKTFGYANVLKNHMRTHTGERPYVCDQCGIGFIISSDLTIHARSHTGEKPYSCKDCAKAFPCVSSLNRHMRTHTNEKPYQCKYCTKKTSTLQNKNQHEKTCPSNPSSVKFAKAAAKQKIQITSQKTSNTDSDQDDTEENDYEDQ